MDIAEWLASLGLKQYAQTFHDNAIEISVLPALTDPHLKELGLPLGHRLKLLQAIAALRDAAPTRRVGAGASRDPPRRRQRPGNCRIRGGRRRLKAALKIASYRGHYPEG
jgi:hypothetical protein